MKKVYTKPSVYIEEFTLSASVASSTVSSCGAASSAGSALGKPGYASPYVCTWSVDIYNYFTTSVDACSPKLEDPNEISIGCYNSGAGGSQIFAS